MTTYKVKPKQYIINASKQIPYCVKQDIIVLNLNACFPKKDNYVKFLECLNDIKDMGSFLNLCNLGSLCYRWQMRYDSQETLNFIQKVVEYIKQNTCLPIIQNNIDNFGETDLKPLDKLASLDNKQNIIYINNVLIECLKILGYADRQIYDIIDFTLDLSQVIPADIIETLPISTRSTLGCYNVIKEMLC